MHEPRLGGPGAPDRVALPRSLVRAMGWARAHLHERPGVGALAGVAGVAPRTLEVHFRRFLGVTPLGWLREERLARARLALSEGRATSVAEAAAAGGFTQLGRFAALYAARFDELPSETRRRLRRVACAAEEPCDEAVRSAWRALPAAFEVAPAACDRALEAVEDACVLAPAYGLPRAIAAWCHGQRVAHRFGGVPAEESAASLRLAEEAVRLAPTDALTLTLSSGALTLAHRLDDAARLLDRALLLEPAAPWAWVRRAWASAYAGDAPAALRQFATTLHLMPFEPVRHLAFIGIGWAHFVAGRHDLSARWALSGCEAAPGSFWGARVAAAAAAHAGARAEARRLVRELLRRDPGLTVAAAHRAWPFPGPVMARLAEGLAAAGLPKG